MLRRENLDLDPNANVDDITRALGTDKRIFPYYLKGGLSYGDFCFPRDNRTFAAFASMYGVDGKLARATDEQMEHLVRLIFYIRFHRTTIQLLF